LEEGKEEKIKKKKDTDGVWRYETLFIDIFHQINIYIITKNAREQEKVQKSKRLLSLVHI
jgi:hypothetical protein